MKKKKLYFLQSNKTFVQNSLLILSECKALSVYLMNSAIKAESYSLNWSHLTYLSCIILTTKIPSATISGDWSLDSVPHQESEQNKSILKYTSE
jgi:hypothetical protein